MFANVLIHDDLERTHAPRIQKPHMLCIPRRVANREGLYYVQGQRVVVTRYAFANCRFIGKIRFAFCGIGRAPAIHEADAILVSTLLLLVIRLFSENCTPASKRSPWPGDYFHLPFMLMRPHNAQNGYVIVLHCKKC